MNIIRSFGVRSLHFIRGFRALMLLAARAAVAGWQERGPHGGLLARNVTAQIRFTGLDALPLVAVAAIALGVIVILQTETFLSGLAEPGFVERTVVFILVRELPAILVGLILIARSGTAVATELANMNLNLETEALAAHGVPPEVYVVLPRLVAFPVASACLTFYFALIAIAGGMFLIPLVSSVPMTLSFATLKGAIGATDVLLPAVKSVLFGFITALLCCSYGLAVRRSFREVPQAATRGVAVSLTTCMVANALISLAAL